MKISSHKLKTTTHPQKFPCSDTTSDRQKKWHRNRGKQQSTSIENHTSKPAWKWPHRRWWCHEAAKFQCQEGIGPNESHKLACSNSKMDFSSHHADAEKLPHVHRNSLETLIHVNFQNALAIKICQGGIIFFLDEKCLESQRTTGDACWAKYKHQNTNGFILEFTGCGGSWNRPGPLACSNDWC